MPVADLASTIHEIPLINVDRLVKLVAKYNRKLAKAKQPLVTFTEGDRVVKKAFYTDSEGVSRSIGYLEYVSITINGLAPSIGGYTLAAVIDCSLAGAIITPLEAGDYTPFRSKANQCDHCNITRKRNTSYVLRNVSTDQYMQVGKTCLKEFTGSLVDPNDYASFLTELADVRETPSNTPRGSEIMPLVEWLAYVCANATAHGFVSKKAMMEYNDKVDDHRKAIQSTANRALINVFGDHDGSGKISWEALEQSAKDMAVLVIEHCRSIVPSSDYDLNIVNLANEDNVSAKYFGYTASMVGMYIRSNLKAREAVKDDSVKSEWLGAIGDKFDVGAKLVSVRIIDGSYGSTYLYRFVTGEGSIMVWFASNEQQIEIDQLVNVYGTVKKHDMFNGTKQTVVTRCRLYPKPR
jgi:hypothetical protein